MYKEIETLKEVVLGNGEKISPVASLEDKYGQRIHIVLDDHCYVLYLEQAAIEAGGAYMINHINKDVFNLLKQLPEPV